MKKTLCIVLSIISLLGMFAIPVSADDPAVSEYYSDVFLSDSYYDASMYLFQQNIMRGMSPGYFSPNTNTTRAQIITMLWRMANCPEPDGQVMSFTDCAPSAFYYKAVQWACSQNVAITNGTSNTTFSPNQAAKQQDTLVFLYRFMCYCGYISDDPVYLTLFSNSTLTNKASFSGYAKRAVGWAYSEGIFTDIALSGTEYCERKNIAEYLYNTYQNYQQKYGLVVVRTHNMSYAQRACDAMNALFTHYTPNTLAYSDISKSQFETVMANAFSQAKALDICYLYCLSHGNTSGLALFTDPSSNRFLSPAFLRNQIDGYSGTFVVFVAGCNTGTYISRKSPQNEDDDTPFDADAFIDDLVYDRVESGELGGVNRIKVLCSSEKDETSYSTMSLATKYWLLGSGYNHLNYTFIDPEADINPYGNDDEKVSLCELFDYSYDKVVTLMPVQHIACSDPDDLFVIFVDN